MTGRCAALVRSMALSMLQSAKAIGTKTILRGNRNESASEKSRRLGIRRVVVADGMVALRETHVRSARNANCAEAGTETIGFRAVPV